MASLSSVIAFILANPQWIALGESAISSVVKLVTDAFTLHKAGVLTDQQLSDVWAAVGVDVASADAAWDAAVAAHQAAIKPAA